METKGKHYVVGIHVTDRVMHIPSVQNVLTEFGCFIKTRIGLHETSDFSCSPNGLIIIELMGDNGKLEEFTSALSRIGGIDVKQMVFTHD